jgi:hypothetical protein
VLLATAATPEAAQREIRGLWLPRRRSTLSAVRMLAREGSAAWEILAQPPQLDWRWLVRPLVVVVAHPWILIMGTLSTRYGQEIKEYQQTTYLQVR